MLNATEFSTNLLGYEIYQHQHVSQSSDIPENDENLIYDEVVVKFSFLNHIFVQCQWDYNTILKISFTW